MQRLQGRKSADSKESETLPLQEQAACEPSALTRSGALQAQSLSRVGRDAQVARLRQEVRLICSQLHDQGQCRS